MSDFHLPLTDARIEEQDSGRFKLLASEGGESRVVNIEFNNRKAARNWARSRGFRIIEAEGGSEGWHGPN